MSTTEDVGFSMPQVEARYRRYVADHYGDVSDIPNICETFWNAGAQAAIRATTQFSDLLPRVTRIEERVAELHGMLQAIAAGAESLRLPRLSASVWPALAGTEISGVRMSGDVLRDVVERARRAQNAVGALGAGGVRHDCAQVERDNSDLFQALATAITRLHAIHSDLQGDQRQAVYDAITTSDLLEVLERTSRPGEQKPA